MVSITGVMPLPLLSLIGWSIVPDQATKHILSLLHRFHVLPPPTPLTYRRQYALTFAAVVLTYLSYNLIDSARSMPPNFYQILSVNPTVDEQGLKAAFRQFARKSHPDRPGVGRDGEELFIMVRDVYEALKDPVVRFAYDRFGPDVLTWSQKCTTTRDYIHQGLLQSSGYHIVVGAFLVFWSFVGSSGPDPVAFWRYLLYATLFVAEISLILSPSPSAAPSASSSFSFLSPSTTGLRGLATTYTTHTLLHTLFPQRINHQHILFLHQLFLFLSIALSRVVPVLIAAFAPAEPNAAFNQEVLQNVANLVAVADRETSISVHTLLHSIGSPPSSLSSLGTNDTQPHEGISSLARPRPFEVPPSVLDLLASPSSPSSSSSLTEKETQNSHPLTLLTREMEELIIEANIKKEDGPLRSVWEAAVRRGRRRAQSEGAMGESDALGEEDGNEKEGGKERNFWEAPGTVDGNGDGGGGIVIPGMTPPSTPPPRNGSSRGRRGSY
ncbi:hypothetical protein Hypma_007420 [Hypsizygus marmoreus]|uniref:J domain-containing protein n=1 Tax=Hypsizygus marmoreus TaxID=39966 RepID=A0A369JV50_HYPMA|nr:hypothetical protein Hypma_007420 [Hypsizygus marmoreus]